MGGLLTISKPQKVVLGRRLRPSTVGRSPGLGAPRWNPKGRDRRRPASRPFPHNSWNPRFLSLTESARQEPPPPQNLPCVSTRTAAHRYNFTRKEMSPVAAGPHDPLPSRRTYQKWLTGLWPHKGAPGNWIQQACYPPRSALTGRT